MQPASANAPRLAAALAGAALLAVLAAATCRSLSGEGDANPSSTPGSAATPTLGAVPVPRPGASPTPGAVREATASPAALASPRPTVTAAAPVAETPAQTPSSTASPTPVEAPPRPPATDVPEPRPEVPTIDPGAALVPPCRTGGPGTGLAGAGTVPFPTPIATPTPVARPLDAGREEVGLYLRRLQPVLAAARFWSALSADLRPHASTPGEFAAIVHMEAARLSAACQAVAILDPPPEAAAVHASVANALAARQGWSAAYLGALRQGAPTRVSEGDEATRNGIAALAGIASKLADRYGIEFPLADAPYTVETERLRASLTVPPGWLLARADRQAVMIAPPELQAPTLAGLGPQADGFGTSLTLRHLLNPPGWTLARAVEQTAALLAPLGEVREEAVVTVGRYQGVERLIVDPAGGWQTGLAVIVAGKRTYFIEAGCPSELAVRCRNEMASLLDGLRLIP